MVLPRLPDPASTRQTHRRQRPDEIDLAQVAATAGIPEDQVERALQLLEQSQYVEAEWGPMMLSGDQDLHAVDLTERGRRAVGIWPSSEGVDALVDALRQAEDATSDPEEKTLIRRAAGAVGMVSRDVMVDVMGAVIARQSGIG
jgi:predicted ArsR family transcriptional regulator